VGYSVEIKTMFYFNYKIMQYDLLKLLVLLSKKTIYGLLILCVIHPLLFAEKTTGQSINDVYISIATKNASLFEVFKEIEGKTEFTFAYGDDVKAIRKKLDLNFSNTSVADVLKVIADKTGVSFRQINGTISAKVKSTTIYAPTNKNVEEPTTGLEYTLSGKVSDETGAPLPGANVTLKGTTMGTSTDANGNYSLRAPDDATTVVFSFIGYATEEVEIAKRTVIDITMKLDVSTLENVVVVGYGTQIKSAITGSIVSIDQKAFQQASISNGSFDVALGGLLKGVSISQSSGQPGSGTDINIRGYTSPLSGGNNQPLFVIDGVPFNTDGQYSTGGQTASAIQANPLLALNPNNIESIEVLKDAGATAIYGSRGANGVILVTTKKGKAGEKMTVDISATTSFGQPIGTLRAMNTQQFKDYTDLVFTNSVTASNNGQIPSFYLFGYTSGEVADLSLDFATGQATYNGLNPAYFGKEDINWNDKVYRDKAVTQQYNLNIRGGSEKSAYTIGASYRDQDGLVINNNFRQYNFNTSVSSTLNKFLKAGATVTIGHTINQAGERFMNDNDLQTISFLNVAARPDLGVRDENGELLRQPVYLFGTSSLNANPVAKLQRKNESKGYTMIGNAFMEAEVYKNLKIKADINTGIFLTKTGEFNPTNTTSDIRQFFPLALPTLDNSETMRINTIANLTATYQVLLDNHKLQFLAGYAWDRTTLQRTINSYQGFPDQQVLITANSAQLATGFGDGKIESGLNSFFARTTYSYKDKYYATANFRSDASSKFGPDNKRGYFPSLSVGWNITHEDFFKNTMIDNLKLRASIGRIGSANVSDFAYLLFFQKSTGSNGLYNGQTAIQVSPTLPNKNIGWETTDEVNVGLDFELLKTRLFGSIDIYSRTTTGALAPTPFPREGGAAIYTSNLMDISNKGIEIELGGHILRDAQGVNWRTSFNWSMNRGKVEKLNGANIQNSFDGQFIFADSYVVGQPVGAIQGYKVAGIYQTQSEVDALNVAASAKYGPGVVYDQFGTGAGDYKLNDTNGDGVITVADQIVLGSIQPDFFGGITNVASFKGFELSAFFQFSVGAKASWQNGQASALPGFNTLAIFNNNTWTPTNTTAQYTRAVIGDPGANSRSTDRTIYDASYLRLKTLQLTYRLPSTLLNKIGFSGVSLFVAASNVLTFSNWPGIDPETVNTGSPSSRTRNIDPYPLSKTISMGLTIQL
jgi:TonB-dependent starch-binding outer membrane protein SusC